jgi:hypothetical protein
MDNRQFDITSDNLADLKLALALAFGVGDHRAAPTSTTHWTVVKTTGQPDTLVLLRWAEGDAHPLPSPLQHGDAAALVAQWLASADYGKEPHIDGSAEQGWRVFNESWGHVRSLRSAICGVQPAWALYGK